MKKTLAYSSTAVLLAISTLAMGCSLISDDGTGVRVRTDSESYDATSAIVNLTVTNLSEDPVYYLCTGVITLQELDAGRVTNAWSVHGFELCGRRTPLAPEESVQFAFDLDSEFLRERLAAAQFDERVRYRFEIDLYADSDLKRPLALEDRLSNQFTIVRR